jgi:hypothetical protein
MMSYVEDEFTGAQKYRNVPLLGTLGAKAWPPPCANRVYSMKHTFCSSHGAVEMQVYFHAIQCYELLYAATAQEAILKF